MEKNRHPPVFRADFHIHTEYSMDSLSPVEKVLDAAVKKGLDAIAITDHNEIAGAFEAKRIAKQRRLPLQIIIGEEVMCHEGDLLVFFIKRKIKPGLLADVLKEVKKQNAVCCAAHPYDFARSGIALEKLPPKILAQIDCIEAFNCRAMVPGMNKKAEGAAEKYGKAVLAGSDSHHPSEIGGAWVEFKGITRLTASSLLSSPRTLRGKIASPHVKVYSRYAVLKKKIAARFK
ncbi:Error-prone DNA polymerase [uncultured archaeon]|nr:Error-prone DNA polymerase [uncultured archaeon]